MSLDTTMSAPATQGTSGAGSGFFSTVSAGLAEGLSRVSSELIPIWAADQLGVQSSDQLNDTTFDPTVAQPRAGETTQSAGFFGPDSQTNILPIGVGGAIVLSAAILGLVLLFRN